jgi:two-component system, cell cycle sensor histidine kinase and response regulator CckA
MGIVGQPEVIDAQLKLLLVGDEDFSYLGELLVRSSVGRLHVDYVSSTSEALARLPEATYDLLLCDYNPGNGSASQLLHQMRQRNPAVPIVFLSDYVSDAAVEAALQSSARAFGSAGDQPASFVARSIRSAIDVYCKERQRQKAEDMLRKLWRAVEQSDDLVIITNREGRTEYVNPAFEALTGYSREEAIGQSLLLLSDHPVQETYQLVWQAILSGNAFRGVVINRKKDGQTFVAEKTVTPLRDAEGEITNFISTDRDITERRRLEGQLQQATKMDAVGRLAGGVAHDFNNLLMVISAYAELMLDSLASEHPLRRNVSEIMGATRRAADLTRQLLAFGRQQVQTLQQLDLNWITQEITQMLLRLLGEDIELVFVPGTNLGKVQADPSQIEQVVMNLAVNARDAMPEGGKLVIETANVRLDDAYIHRHSIVPPGDYVLLAVTDSGAGIAPQHLSHIFEPFFTTKEEGKGTGLGLATVYGIVKQNRGFVWVYSEPKLGTTFKIYLPRAQKETIEVQLPKPVETSFRGSETLLLVEDETAVRQSAREFLCLSGYSVLEAANGEDAVRVSKEYDGAIHLMISDVVMPKMGGAKLAELLVAERPDMKVLFVSGYAEKTVLRHGAIDVTTRFLQKPFSLKMLARKVREVLGTEILGVEIVDKKARPAAVPASCD